MGLVAWAGGAVAWAGGCGGMGKWLWWRGSGGFSRSLPFFLSLSLSLSLFFPLNQAFMGLIVWWSSWV